MCRSLGLLVEVLVNDTIALISFNDPVIVDVVHDLSRDNNLRMLLVVMVQEVLVVEDRLFRLFFALLELELFAGLLGSLEFFPSIDTLPVLMLIGLVSIVACLFTVLLTLLLFLLLGLALLSLQLGLVRAHRDITSSRLNRKLNPTPDDGERVVVLGEALERVLSDQALDERETLVGLDVVRLGTLVLILLHGRNQLLHPQLLRALPEQLLRLAAVSLADFANLEAEQVEDGLDERLELDDFALRQALETLFDDLVLLEEVNLVLEAHIRRDLLLLLN